MAWARSLTPDQTTPIHLHYLLRRGEGAPFVKEFKPTAALNLAFSLSVQTSSKSGRLDANEVVRSYASSMKDTAIFYCGPEGVRADLEKAVWTLA